MSTSRIAEVIRQFVDGFNTNSLDDVMSFFADDAVYEPGDGRTHRGRAAIREAFRPQFANAYGTLRFVVSDQVVDEGGRKAAIRWVCQHDFATTVQGPVRTAGRLVRHRHLSFRRTRKDRRQVQLRQLRPPAPRPARSRRGPGAARARAVAGPTRFRVRERGFPSTRWLQAHVMWYLHHRFCDR